VNQVVPDAELAATAGALARQLAAGATRAFGTVKSLLASTFSESLETQMELEARGIAAMAGGADGREGSRRSSPSAPPNSADGERAGFEHEHRRL
jgi:2-(1,2-epoxy-1,2-dihydrophenyl)acetyl-CoA isomerase